MEPHFLIYILIDNLVVSGIQKIKQQCIGYMYSNIMGLTTLHANINIVFLVLIALIAARTVNKTINFERIRSSSWQLCGNGLIEAMEQCDDGNSEDMDGCSSDCQLQKGYKCKTESPSSKSLCFEDITPTSRVLVGENGTNVAICGNSILETGQECDDGNLIDGDGCSSTCQIQIGFRCLLVYASSQCRSICGDGLVVGKEQCDDGNVKSGDGCSSSCKVEAGYSCNYSSVSHKSVCCINGTEYSTTSDSCVNTTNNSTSSSNATGSNSSSTTNSTANASNTTNNATTDTNSTSNSTVSNATDTSNSTTPDNTTISNQTSSYNTTNASSQTNETNTTNNSTYSNNITNTTNNNLTNTTTSNNTNNPTINDTSNTTTNNQTNNSQTDLSNATNSNNQSNTTNNQTNTTNNNTTDTNNQTNLTNNTANQNSSPFLVSLFLKIPSENSIIVQLQSTARLLTESSLIITANFPYQTYQIKPSASNKLLLQFNYNVSLNDYSQLYLTINNQTVSLPTVTSNNLALKYYPPQYYSIYHTFSILMPIFAYVILFLLILTFLFSSKLIAVQTLFILQFTFGGLLMMRKIQSIMYPFKELWIFDGYNIRNHYGSYVPPRIGALDMTSDFISNFNISIAIYLLPLVIGAIFSFKKLGLFKYRAVILGEWQLSVMLICIQQLVFAFVINIQYSRAPAFGIIFGVLLLLLYFFYMYRLYDRKKQAHLTTKNQFGDYKIFFQVNFLNFYVFSMVYRLSLSLVLVLMSDSIISQSLALVLTVLWAAIIIIKRPYKKSAKLIPIINSLIMVLISIFYLYQRNKADNPQINFSTFMPITLICILGLTCIFNTLYAGMNFRSLRRRREEMKRRIEQHAMGNNVSSLADISHQFIENGMSLVISDLTNNSHIIGKEFMEPGHNHQSTDFKVISEIKPRQFGSLEISQECQRQKGIYTLQGLQEQRKEDSLNIQASLE